MSSERVIRTFNPLGALVEKARRRYRVDGFAVIPNFLSEESLEFLTYHAAGLLKYKKPNVGPNHIYADGRPIPEDLPATHPLRWSVPERMQIVSMENIPLDSPVRAFHRQLDFIEFLEDVTGVPKLFPYDDDLGGINLTIYGHEEEKQWHFDQNEITATLNLTEPSLGGEFQLAPNVRTESDERFDLVAQIISGREERIVTISSEPGSLLIFPGKRSLHRVCKSHGVIPRATFVLAYDSLPDSMSSENLRATRYG